MIWFSNSISLAFDPTSLYKICGDAIILPFTYNTLWCARKKLHTCNRPYVLRMYHKVCFKLKFRLNLNWSWMRRENNYKCTIYTSYFAWRQFWTLIKNIWSSSTQPFLFHFPLKFASSKWYILDETLCGTLENPLTLQIITNTLKPSYHNFRYNVLKSGPRHLLCMI